MSQNRYARWGFTLVLAGAFFVGGFALMSDPAEAAPWCPRKICANTNGWDYYGGCNFYERATDCLFACDKYTYTSPSSGLVSTCRTNCIPL